MAFADKQVHSDQPLELSDSELLAAAAETGTFDFLDAPEEDGYNDLLPKHE
jgi:hypothetical protein